MPWGLSLLPASEPVLRLEDLASELIEKLCESGLFSRSNLRLEFSAQSSGEELLPVDGEFSFASHDSLFCFSYNEAQGRTLIAELLKSSYADYSMDGITPGAAEYWQPGEASPSLEERRDFYVQSNDLLGYNFVFHVYGSADGELPPDTRKKQVTGWALSIVFSRIFDAPIVSDEYWAMPLGGIHDWREADRLVRAEIEGWSSAEMSE